jgi:hypothetical protein
VRAATRSSPGDYVFESCSSHNCFDSSAEHDQFVATVGKCPHLTSFELISALNHSRTFALQFSEALSSIPVVRGRRITRASGSSGCEAFDADFDLVTTRDGSDKVNVSMDSEMVRCIEHMELVLPETSDLSLAFNRDFTCQPAESLVSLSLRTDQMDVWQEFSLIPALR